MLQDWNLLSDELQLMLSREALRHAAATIAGQAEVLAGEIETGGLADRGGPDALRLLANLVRVTGCDSFGGDSFPRDAFAGADFATVGHA